MVTRLKKNERGVALLAVLLGVALMTLIVVDFAMTSGLGFVSAANQANELRSGFLARSAINVGLALLAADARDKQQQTGNGTTAAGTPVEALTDPWAVPFPPMTLGGGNVSLTIVDEDRKLNINTMIGQNGQPNLLQIAKLQRLFAVLDVNADLVQGIVDWITPSGASGSGNGGDYYLGLKPPYQPRNGPMPTIGDLQMVQGFNEAIFNRVSPFLTTMPTTTVNANTAAPQVLAALEPQLMQDQKIVQAIVELRPFTSGNPIGNLPGLDVNLQQALNKDVGYNSHFFTINGTGTYAGARQIIIATFHRETNGIGTLAAWHED